MSFPVTEVLAGAFYAEAFADEYVAAVAVGDFNDVSLFPHFLDILQ